jgi:hypothetical protein
MRDVMEAVTNKQFLHTIVDNEYIVPADIDSYTLARALLGNFASPDGELRDDLSYMVLANGLIDKRKLTLEQLEVLLITCMDDQHLFYRVGEVGTDSVFMRSFSALAINTILYTDAKEPQLSRQLLLTIKTALLRYTYEERDWRGYVDGKGWAHAMTHLADALDECAQNNSMTSTDREEILSAVYMLAKLPEPLYHEEDTRLATVVYHIIACKQLDEEIVSEWLKTCLIRRGPDVASWTSVTNMKNFLRSLYFRLLWDSVALGLIEQIAIILKQQDEMYIQ